MDNERTDRTEVVATIHHSGSMYRVAGVLADGLDLEYGLEDLFEFLQEEFWDQLRTGQGLE